MHVPKRQVRQKRSLINYRDDVVKRITKIKNSIRAILGREDIHLPSERFWRTAFVGIYTVGKSP